MTINPFHKWWAAGYRDLIPVVPPDAPLSEKSHIALNKTAGKAPGILYPNGLWGGFKGWHDHIATEADIEAWGAMGASVGLRRGDAFLLDIDATDEATADAIEAAAISELGPAPLRVGRWPKRALLYRAEGSIPGMKLTFTGPDGKVNQIETPGQVVISGTHPGTGTPYRWRRKPIPFAELTPVSAEKLEAFIEHQRRILPAAKKSISGVAIDRAAIDQESLKGDLKWVRLAMENMPNTAEHFPHYDDMIRVGNALHAALADHPEEARELWHLWGEKWEGGDYDYEKHEKRWYTLQAPHAFGYDWLLKKAADCGVTVNRLPIDAARHFDTPDAPLVEVDQNPPAEETNPWVSTETYPLLRPMEIVDRPPPKFLIDRHIPEHAVGFLYSEPGAGKSFLALDMALHIAAGRTDWHGDPIATGDSPAILYIAAEGSYGFRNRIRAWCERHDTTPADLNRFLMIEHSINFMHADDIQKLARTVDAAQRDNNTHFALIVIDTVSRAMPGADENLQKDMTRFVQACDLIKARSGATVLGIHHAGKSGDMRGSTVLLGAGDFVFRLTRKKGASIGALKCEKQKDAEDGWEQKYQFEKSALTDGQSSLTVARVEEGIGPSQALTPGTTEEVFAAMQAAWDAGSPWSLAPQTGDRRAIRRMVQDHGFEAEAAENTLNIWLGSGLIMVDLVSAKSRVKGLRVCREAGQAVLGEGVFE